MEKSKINSIQLATILIFVITAPLTGINLTYILNSSGVDAYICPLIASIMGIPLLFIFLFIFNYKPDLSLGEKINYAFGKKIGAFINFLLICLTLFFSITLFYNLIDFIVSQFLPETPPKVVGLLFGFIIIYLTTKGTETISRVSLILFFLTSIPFIISLFGVFGTFELSNIKPFFEFGIDNTLKGSLHILSVNYFPIFLLLTVPKNQIVDNKKFSKWLIVAYILSTIFMFLIILFLVGNLGIRLATTYQYPEYIVLKRINLFDFLDRIENFLSMQKIIKEFMLISFFVFFISNTIKFNKDSKMIPILSVATIFLISQNVFKSNTMFNKFVLSYISRFRLVFFIIIILITIILFIRKKLEKK